MMTEQEPEGRNVGLSAWLDAAMRKMPEAWRSRWCEPGKMGCGCLGCANRSGGLLRLGYTKEQWQEWMASNAD